MFNKLPAAVNKFGLRSAEACYKDYLYLHQNKFSLQTIQSNSIVKLLKNVKVNQAAAIDIFTRAVKDGGDILSKPITQICNIKPTHFPNNCELAKLNPLYIKGSITDPKNFRRSPFYLKSQKI